MRSTRHAGWCVRRGLADRRGRTRQRDEPDYTGVDCSGLGGSVVIALFGVIGHRWQASGLAGGLFLFLLFLLLPLGQLALAFLERIVGFGQSGSSGFSSVCLIRTPASGRPRHGAPNRPTLGLVTREDAHRDDTGPLVDFGFQHQRIGDAQPAHVQQRMPVVGGDAGAQRGAGRRSPRSAGSAAAPPSRSPPPATETVPAHRPACWRRRCRRSVRPGRRRSSRASALRHRPLDHAALRVDLVGTVDVDRQPFDLGRIDHDECRGPAGARCCVPNWIPHRALAASAAASASMKWSTVEPVPTPSQSPSTT